MRYFEIVKPSVGTDPREGAVGERRSGRIEKAGELTTANSPQAINRINRPSRRQHLSPRRSQ
jgi:hypothetical protein